MRGSFVVRLASSREWIARSGPQARRRTTFVFSLGRPALVEFVVFRIAPDCRFAGRFLVHAHAGVNRVHFRGRIGRRFLRPGTYRIVAHTVPTGQTTMRTKLVIFGAGKPTQAQVATAKAANTCPAGLVEREAVVGALLSGGAGGGGELTAEPASTVKPVARASGPLGGVLGNHFDRADDAFKTINPLIWIGLGMAIALLALAALPVEHAPNARIEMLLAYRRLQIAFVGTMALIGVGLAYAFA